MGRNCAVLHKKRGTGKSMTIPADVQGAKRVLNFSGDQRKRVMAAAHSANNWREHGMTSGKKNTMER